MRSIDRVLLAICEFGPTQGGIATFYNSLSEDLALRGVDVFVCSPDADVPQVAGVRHFPVSPVAVAHYKDRFRKFSPFPGLHNKISLAFAIQATALEAGDFDVVETVDYNLTFLPWALLPSEKPVVVQLHGSSGQVSYYDNPNSCSLEASIERWMEVRYLADVDHIQGGGRQNILSWEKMIDRNIQYLPPQFTYRENDTSVSERSWPSGQFGLVVGRLQAWKGAVDLCDALRIMGTDAPRILWAGHDHVHHGGLPMSVYLSTTYPDVWGRSLIWVGSKSRDVIRKMQHEASFCIAPSRWDTFNISVLEAMNAGRCVICSTGAGASDFIVDGENGMLSRPADPSHLADVIANTVNLAPEKLIQIGQAARGTIRSEFAPGRIAGLRLRHYEQLKPSRRPVADWMVADFESPKSEDDTSQLNRYKASELLREVAARGVRRILGY